MLFKTNILALVTSDENIHKLIMWDDNQSKVLCEFKFNYKILNVKLSKDKIIVICRAQIFIFNLNNFKEIDKIETGDNPYGAVALSAKEDQALLAYPDKEDEKKAEKGLVKIKNFEKSKDLNIKAHQNKIAYLLLSHDNRVIASASEKGTLIPIFNTENGNLLQELRRGKDKVDIKYICFELNLKYIAASSNKGTIHIWSLSNTLKKLNNKESKESECKENNLIENQSSNFKWLPNYLGGLGAQFFNGEWSFDQIRNIEPKSIFCFGNENTIIIVSSNGKYYNFQIEEKSGNKKTWKEYNLL